MSNIPTSSGVRESCVIAAPLADVWHQIKIGDFANFWNSLSKSALVKNNTSPEADIAQWTFKDGTQLEVKQEEHSVRICAFLYLAKYRIFLTT
jgi:hypothetical protein